MYNTDCFLTQGSSHTICEDYTTRSDDTVVVCDGCSTSPDTDFGARILARFALSQASTYGTLLHPSHTARAVEAAILTIPNLSFHAADATLLTAKVRGDCVDCSVFGDGFIVVRKDGYVTIYDIEYESGAPGYLSYHISPQRLQEYDRKFKGKKKILTISHYLESSFEAIETNFLAHLENSPEKKFVIPDPLDSTTRDLKPLDPWQETFLNPDAVLIFSDGLSTFEAKFPGLRVPVPVPVILHNIFRIRKPNPHYLTRRLKMFLTDEVTWKPKDDFSVASIWRKVAKKKKVSR